jgi:hypothetical protein
VVAEAGEEFSVGGLGRGRESAEQLCEVRGHVGGRLPPAMILSGGRGLRTVISR